jgi:hypothetical protein
MNAISKKILSAFSFIGISFLLSLLYWLIVVYVIINDGALKNFRYMGF